MGRTSLRWIFAAALGLSLSSPAQSNEILQQQPVVECLAQHGGDPIACLGVILSPCAHQGKIGFGRACYARLSRIWFNEIRGAEEKEPALAALQSKWPTKLWITRTRQASFDGLESRCHAEVRRLAQERAVAQHEIKNACHLMEKSHWWYRVTQTPDALIRRRNAFAKNAESLKACLLASSNVEHAGQCVGLFGDNCDTVVAAQVATCRKFAQQLWFEVLMNTVGPEQAFRDLDASGVPPFSENRENCFDARSCSDAKFVQLIIEYILDTKPN